MTADVTAGGELTSPLRTVKLPWVQVSVFSDVWINQVRRITEGDSGSACPLLQLL